ncbi:MAG: hypothetical protein LBQ54_10105 [Planctomycetaceae bacterium]|jgi:hypothetical protein|nr:hypothetical protein [Planctomycetaceae bacterium]
MSEENQKVQDDQTVEEKSNIWGGLNRVKNAAKTVGSAAANGVETAARKAEPEEIPR